MGSPRAIILLIVAAFAAIALAVIVRGAFGHKTPTAAAPIIAAKAPTTQVLVAQRDLGVGERLAQGDLGWQAWPAGDLNPNYITDGGAPVAASAGVAAKAEQKVAQTARAVTVGQDRMGALYGAIVKQALVKGEPVVSGKLVRGGEGGYMAVVLDPGMRAMSVPISVDKAAGGFILPGDHVDVIQSRELAGVGPQTRPTMVSDTLLRNVRVLAIDQKTTADKNAQAMVGAVATLEVAASAAEALARAQAQGQGQGGLSLALRSLADSKGPSERAHTVFDEDADHGRVVRIFRGDQVSEVSTR
ncbi:Flp pilus assembly protein CpaB [Caulobacter sp. CCUG 60055]|uniref:Flp pilus assembly protein CpaB n=1 Tax=Caulobacter sp. CCUG 60055 TaxID=2100090 RepID=UPI001FA6F5B9|nr:Flp pilus assembly protein CpaB [Caulobacter sp. CCUG 60055]